MIRRCSCLLLLGLVAGCSTVEAPTRPAAAETAFMKRVRRVFARVPETLAKNYKTFAVPDGTVRGFGAGEAYPQIWLRDSAWIVPAAAAYYGVETLTSWLDLHLSVAEKSGRLRDWVAAAPPGVFREWAPKVAAVGSLAVDTNSNESDQESSAAFAYCRVVEALRGEAQVKGRAHEDRVARLVRAMDALLRDRTDGRTGLLWSGLTADWGDVSPVYPDQRAIYRDAKTPRTLSLYSNVIAYAALDCLSTLDGPKAVQDRLAGRALALRDRIRSAFWMRDRGFFKIRLPLDALPPGFGEDDDRFALGGNALAALFGAADDTQAASIFEVAERRRGSSNLSTISTTLIPPYAASVFQHPAMREPFQYQNGGQWDWFGAALIEAEFERGHSERARAHLDQVVSRILRAGPGLHEWYSQDGQPRGSASYAASAAALHNAVAKGLIGVSRSPAGYRVVIRTAETLLPFNVPQRAASTGLTVGQVLTASGIEVTVQGTAPVREICTVLPQGRVADMSASQTRASRRVHQIGLDTVLCADVASPLPVRVRFAINP